MTGLSLPGVALPGRKLMTRTLAARNLSIVVTPLFDLEQLRFGPLVGPPGRRGADTGHGFRLDRRGLLAPFPTDERQHPGNLPVVQRLVHAGHLQGPALVERLAAHRDRAAQAV